MTSLGRMVNERRYNWRCKARLGEKRVGENLATNVLDGTVGL